MAKEVFDALALQRGCDALWQRVIWLAKLSGPCWNDFHMGDLAWIKNTGQGNTDNSKCFCHPDREYEETLQLVSAEVVQCCSWLELICGGGRVTCAGGAAPAACTS